LQIDNRFFGGKHFNDMEVLPDPDAAGDLSLKTFFQERMEAVQEEKVALAKKADQLDAELGKIQRLLLEVDRQNQANEIEDADS
jgi:predicted Rossmann fold nucleotide-binding protein DprA/Smf involved in DNA uptake